MGSARSTKVPSRRKRHCAAWRLKLWLGAKLKVSKMSHPPLKRQSTGPVYRFLPGVGGIPAAPPAMHALIARRDVNAGIVSHWAWPDMASSTLCARESEGAGPALLQATGWEPRGVLDIGFAEPAVDGACGDKGAEDLLDPARIFRTPIAARPLAQESGLSKRVARRHSAGMKLSSL